MTLHQRIVAAVFALTLLGVIIELVRRRKLREEYAWLWVLAGLACLILGLNYRVLEGLTQLIGAGWTSSTLFFLGIFFVLALSLQFSVKVSRLENQVKNLAQQMALHEAREPAEPQQPPDEEPEDDET